MEKILKPYWLLITVTIPQSIMFLVFWKIYSIISTELESKNTIIWSVFGAGLGTLCAGVTIYAIYLILKSKDVNPFCGVIGFITYIPLLYGLCCNFGKLIPPGIPAWMIFDINPAMVILTLLMPAFAYGMLLLVICFMPEPQKYSFLKDIIVAVLIPAGWYFLVVCVAPFTRSFIYGAFDLEIFAHFMAVAFILSTLVFLMIFVRIIFVLLMKKSSLWKKITAPIILILPVLGLFINTKTFNIMGDFSNPWYFVLAVITPLLLIIPEIGDRKARTLLFLAKAITFPFTLYFFVVFLPYLPFSIIAILAVGFGFLMLSPHILMMVHIKSLWNDFVFLSGYLSKLVLSAIFVVGFMVMPAGITFTFLRDDANLDNAINLIYRHDLDRNEDYRIDISGIKRAIRNIEELGNRGSTVRSLRASPYIDAYYKWLVLDNLTLSNEKVNTLKRVFFGDAIDSTNSGQNSVETPVSSVGISKYNVETEFDEKNGYFKSWIHLNITNYLEFQQEYFTTFKLPFGCYISDYYLIVNGQKKHGLVADKRAANWIYRQITRANRDPGLLSYNRDGSISFRVFPFAAYETRSTGIQIIHKEQVQINLGDKTIILGNNNKKSELLQKEIQIGDSIVYVPYESKKALQSIKREQKYYFIMDFSKNSMGKLDSYMSRLNKFLEKAQLSSLKAEVIATNYEVKRFKLDENLSKNLTAVKARGGFFLELPVKRILYENYTQRSKECPIIIVITDELNNAVFTDDFEEMKRLVPDIENYYCLDGEGNLVGLPLSGENNTGLGFVADEITQISVLAWPDLQNPIAFLADDGKDSIVLKDSNIDISPSDLSKSDYINGIMLDAMSLSLAMHPEKYSGKSIQIVKSSILSRIMTPLTSFIVLETEAQEKVLLEKQKQILASNSALDIDEQTQMSEPSVIIIAIVFGAFILIRKLKERFAG